MISMIFVHQSVILHSGELENGHLYLSMCFLSSITLHYSTREIPHHLILIYSGYDDAIIINKFTMITFVLFRWPTLFCLFRFFSTWRLVLLIFLSFYFYLFITFYSPLYASLISMFYFSNIFPFILLVITVSSIIVYVRLPVYHILFPDISFSVRAVSIVIHNFHDFSVSYH